MKWPEANKICNMIEKYWERRGFDNVVAWPEIIEDWVAVGPDREEYYIKSNLINGLPPKNR